MSKKQLEDKLKSHVHEPKPKQFFSMVEYQCGCGMYFTKKTPFSDVIIHATILTKDGKRMSKSLGTGIDPMTLIEKYGADATRFGLIWQSMGGQDMHWAEEHVVAGRKFCNKLWNIARFVLQQNIGSQTEGFENMLDEDAKMVAALSEIKRKVTEFIEKYEFGQALHLLYEFIWHDFADKYIEFSKRNDQHKKIVLQLVLKDILRLLHPFMPFITEEIWDKLPIKDKKLLIIESWPK